jgi:DNA-binding XRE family transcriptional regulator
VNTRFRELLKNADINGAQLGRRLGVSTAVVNAWVHGKAKPKSERWREIATHLSCSVDDVVKCFI